jgi:hypothetical protein
MRHQPLAFACAADGFPSSDTGSQLLQFFSRVGVAAVAGFLVACGSHGKSISMDREILIPDVKPRVDAIVRTRDGGFIVTGFGVTAWAVATDNHGTSVWQFIDPIDSKIDTGSRSVPQSEFHGAVPLANGNTLLCGGKYKNGQTNSLLVILDRHGKLVEKRMEVPNDDTRSIFSNFYRCFPWQDGLLLLGNTNDGAHGSIWLVELDGNGVKRRQAFVDNLPAVAAGTVVGPSFVFTAWDSQDSFRIIRANEKGEIIAKRVIAGEFIVQLRSMVESGQTSVIIYSAGRASLYTLDERLRDARPPREIANFDVLAGCGYVLADASIALFGRRPNAAVAWMSGKDKTYAVRPFDSKYISSTVSDAVPVSADQFVTVRGSVSQDPRDQGLVMSWVSINAVGNR